MRSTLTFFAQKLRKSEGFTLLELVVVIAVLSILSSISIPALLGFIERAAARAAQYSLNQAHRECRTKIVMGAANPTYIIPANNAYFQFPDLGRDGFCSDPATGNILTAARTDGSQTVSLYNLNINVVTGEKSSDRDVPNWVAWGNSAEQNFRKALLAAARNGLLLESGDKYYVRGKSRYVVVEGETWEEAQANAEALGGSLVTIDSEEENEWIAEQFYGDDKVSDLIADRGAAFWTGLNDKDSEGNWSETSGESNEYRNWAPGEPDGGSSYKSGENYAIYLLFDSYNRDPGMWNDQPNDGSVQYGLAEIKVD